MKVFKFGGASIKDANSIRNMTDIVGGYPDDSLVIVVSAMGKTTNKLEQIFFKKLKNEDFGADLDELKKYHYMIIQDLFKEPSDIDLKPVNELFANLESMLASQVKNRNGAQLYDAVVSYGELLSSTIIGLYMQGNRMKISWIDARNLIKTDQTYREGKINWEITESLIKQTIREKLSESNFITQGFIGSTKDGHTTTLGREGSDFTAAIFGASLDAESVTIWKDVPGILNADPKRFEQTQLYSNLSYQEAAEMTYYGASVIHPKTIKPLANKNISLLVRSFENPLLEGTEINKGDFHDLPPTYVVKDKQCLVSFGVKDLTFINEKNLSIIFHILDKLNIKINMMQNSAISLTVCFDFREDKVSKLLDTLKNDFKILYNQDLQLITIKNYTQDAINRVSANRDILVEQRTRHTYQIVVK
ncbi:MAG: aspartate kinase [Cyclobacteriaceae bacterium]|jgi:aspartate kinase